MKKILAYIAVAATVVACDIYGEPEESTAPVKAGDIKIEISEVKDSSFKVTLTPLAEAAYYSYLVDESDQAEDLDASTLYSVGYSSVKQGTVSYSAYPSYSFTVEANPNTSYVVYAVSSSIEGNVGTVATASTCTSDKVAPFIVDFDTDGRVASFTFSENVKYVEGKKFIAKYYASCTGTKLDQALLDESEKRGETEIAEVEVDGNVANVNFKELPDGAYYAIVMEDGAFVDATGLACDGFETSFVYDPEEEASSPTSPFYGHVPAAAIVFALSDYSEYKVMTDYTESFDFAHVLEVGSIAANAVVVTREFSIGNKFYTEESTPVYGVSQSGFFVKLSEEPNRGDILTITIPEKAFYDLYGNYNAAITIGPFLYSYGYTLDDVAGDYIFSSTSAYAAYGYGPYENEITISASDNEELGNIMFTGQLSDVDVKFYADFDTDLGTITLPQYPIVGIGQDVAYDEDWNPIKDGDDYVLTDYYLSLRLSNGSAFYSIVLSFSVPASHTLTFDYAGKAYIGLLEIDANGNLIGWYDQLLLNDISLKTSGSEDVNTASARSFKPFTRPVLSEDQL